MPITKRDLYTIKSYVEGELSGMLDKEEYNKNELKELMAVVNPNSKMKKFFLTLGVNYQSISKS